MNAHDFVVAIAACAPETDRLVKTGLTHDQAGAFRETYQCIPKNSESRTSTDPLIDLIHRYDLSTVEIGVVRFVDTPIYHSKYLQVGEVEADPLVINHSDGEINVVDLADDRHTLWHCAEDGSSFLEALVYVDCFLSRRIGDNRFARDQRPACEVAARCAVAAGGIEFVAFYRMLVGCQL